MPAELPAAAQSALAAARLVDRLDQLAAITDVPGTITRLYLSPAHRRAADLVAGWMREAGMTARIDAAGSVIGRYEGAAPDAPVLLLGSHIDSVRDAGRYDGNLGVVLAIAAVEALSAQGRHLAYAIEVAAFGDEEGVRYASTLSGSAALAGRFDPKWLDETDAEGISRRDALVAFGCDPAGIAAEARDPARLLAYLEVHIEQGPVLEAEGRPLGIVTGINGVSRGRIQVTGDAGHAGTVPMPLRRDALTASAEMLLVIEDFARAQNGFVATVGQIEVPGGAVNVVPGRVNFTFDMRSGDDAARREAVTDISDMLREIAQRRDVGIAIDMGYDAPAAASDAGLMDALAASIERAGLGPRKLGSGAGHDAMSFRGVVPLAMMFVRCRKGVSHNPAEYTAPEDIGIAAQVFYDTVQSLPAQRGA